MSVAERFWPKVDATDPSGCWLWTGALNSAGYGRFHLDEPGLVGYAHRVAYEIQAGPIPAGMTIDHLCRVKRCVNPAHLEAVTIGENVRRHHALKTACVNGHPWPENSYINGRGGRRRCRLCHREQNRNAARRRALRAGTAVLVVALVAVLPAVASAHPTRSFVRNRTSIRTVAMSVLGHHVRMTSWRPGDRHARVLVGYSRHRHTVTGWAGAHRKRSRSVAAINGGTWRWSTNRPVGTVWSMGRRITRTSGHPAVGFLPRGRVVFGARSARRRGSVNIVAGEAVLIRHSRILSRYPYANAAQESCGPRGTDGAGCFRSNVVRFRNGRAALVEIGFATMAQAAAVLKRMGARAAVTFDSGGSAVMWTLKGRGGCADRRAAGRCYGIAHAAGLHWERQVPDAIILEARR
jgi:hypothetical protein